ncbi:MAG: riboflavin biosynthesis protein RibF [Candidatus Calescibacterium sp.]|nr:riboflavin biosynthesis protein RibF [Candidatus Calescibacterium sp.]
MVGIALGFFDGIHIGHQKVIQNIYSKESFLITFDTSPKIFFKNLTNCLLTSNHEKLEVIKSLFPELKVEFLIFKNIYNLSAEEFIKYLKSLIDFNTVSVGYDFKFGKNAEGNIKTLKKLSKIYKFELIVQEPVYYKQKIVHSTLIRNYLINYPHKLEDVSSMLNRYYSITGIVVEGQKIGRKIGFPTANILVPQYKIIPYFGIYKANVYILNDPKNKKYEGLLYIGPRPVINNYQISTEVWIKNFNQEIYYQPIKVELVKFIRKIKNFKNLNSMVKQIEKDIELAFT